MKIHFHRVEREHAENALRKGPSFAGRVLEHEDCDVAVYAASLAGSAISLGAYQRERDVLAAPPTDLSFVRRQTGGAALWAGEGVDYLAFGLRTASVFMPCPRDRILNRNIRGLLVGLSSAGVPVHYFGRDWAAAEHRPAVYVAWSGNADGAVLLEFFAASTRSFIPSASRNIDAMSARGPVIFDKQPLTLAEVWNRDIEPGEVADRIVGGYAKAYGRDIEFTEFDDDDAMRDVGIPSEPDAGLNWSSSHEIPIGTLRAACKSTAGVITDIGLCGEFMQEVSGPARLREALVGKPLTAQTLASGINATYGSFGVVIEGLKSLNPMLNAFLEAANLPLNTA